MTLKPELVHLHPNFAREANALRYGLLAISTAGDGGPFAEIYRAAGGGYEGLQAIATESLRVADEFAADTRRWLEEEVYVGHAAYAQPLNGGWAGYRAACHDCDWRGERTHPSTAAGKSDAQDEANQHRRATRQVVDPDRQQPGRQ